MKDTPFDFDIVTKNIEKSKIANIGKASIRELKHLVNNIEKETCKKFIRMEMGVPGIEANKIAIEAEINALRNGVASVYPEIEGVESLKIETARFCKLFLDIDVSYLNCIPTVGSMQGGFAAFLTTNRIDKNKDTILFLDPGFPVQKQQCNILGEKHVGFDVYDYRGDKLRAKLESYLSLGNISALVYSNPNNPSWICFTERELAIIGELAEKYNTIVIEDLAYFGMDFRNDISTPGKAPFQPTVAKYCSKYILLLSSSKAFSYAGQRIAMLVISDSLAQSVYPDLKRFYTTDNFGRTMIYGTIYALSAGTCHSTQYALAAIFKEVNEGRFNFVNVIKEYGDKAKVMKKLFVDNGFKIVYDKDEDKDLADGFYFTISYPNFSGEKLLRELLYYGISAISLSITGSHREEGLRACVSLVNVEQFPELEQRLKIFNANNPIT
ncbi:MAG: aminotransferase [Bacteroidetes bacterium GWE2_29_8]|nr:MAG: aminotransferase [Bacteroidetes bacterium GWE2_29_8]OFY16754.1 MAG: aminotransferase [Bacteroidetes bacterium GWF2_29_10]